MCPEGTFRCAAERLPFLVEVRIPVFGGKEKETFEDGFPSLGYFFG